MSHHCSLDDVQDGPFVVTVRTGLYAFCSACCDDTCMKHVQYGIHSQLCHGVLLKKAEFLKVQTHLSYTAIQGQVCSFSIHFQCHFSEVVICSQSLNSFHDDTLYVGYSECNTLACFSTISQYLTNTQYPIVRFKFVK